MGVVKCYPQGLLPHSWPSHQVASITIIYERVAGTERELQWEDLRSIFDCYTGAVFISRVETYKLAVSVINRFVSLLSLDCRLQGQGYRHIQPARLSRGEGGGGGRRGKTSVSTEFDLMLSQIPNHKKCIRKKGSLNTNFNSERNFANVSRP